jgi:hypothetical protein
MQAAPGIRRLTPGTLYGGHEPVESEAGVNVCPANAGE